MNLTVLLGIVASLFVAIASIFAIKLKRRYHQQDENLETRKQGTAARFEAGTELQRQLLERVDNLEVKYGEQIHQSIERERRISSLENEAANCKADLAEEREKCDAAREQLVQLTIRVKDLEMNKV